MQAHSFKSPARQSFFFMIKLIQNQKFVINSLLSLQDLLKKQEKCYLL